MHSNIKCIVVESNRVPGCKQTASPHNYSTSMIAMCYFYVFLLKCLNWFGTFKEFFISSFAFMFITLYNRWMGIGSCLRSILVRILNAMKENVIFFYFSSFLLNLISSLDSLSVTAGKRILHTAWFRLFRYFAKIIEIA